MTPRLAWSHPPVFATRSTDSPNLPRSVRYRDYLPRIHPNDLAGFEAEIERALHEHDAFRLDYRIRTDDGSTRWVTSRGAVIGDSKGGSRLVGAIFDITARKQAELEAAAARERTEILFREMNHRTKNNLTIVASMLHLQASAVKQDAEIRRHLDAARERITTIAELHTSLYQGTTLGEIDFADYIRNLCAHIQTSLLSGDRGITFVVKDRPRCRCRPTSPFLSGWSSTNSQPTR